MNNHTVGGRDVVEDYLTILMKNRTDKTKKRVPAILPILVRQAMARPKDYL